MLSRKFWIGVGAAAALMGGALLYGYLTREDTRFAKMQLELKELGKVRRNEDGTIRVDDFCKLFAIISKHGKKASADRRQEFITKRRDLLRENKEEEYRAQVVKQMVAEEEVYQDVASYALEQLGVRDEEFLMSQQQNMSNPQFQRTMMEMQMQGAGQERSESGALPPHLTREKTKEIYHFIEELRTQMMREQVRGAGSQDPTLEMMIQQSKMSDLVYEKFKVEEEEFTRAVQQFKILEDPDMRKQNPMANLLSMMGQAGH